MTPEFENFGKLLSYSLCKTRSIVAALAEITDMDDRHNLARLIFDRLETLTMESLQNAKEIDEKSVTSYLSNLTQLAKGLHDNFHEKEYEELVANRERFTIAFHADLLIGGINTTLNMINCAYRKTAEIKTSTTEKAKMERLEEFLRNKTHEGDASKAISSALRLIDEMKEEDDVPF